MKTNEEYLIEYRNKKNTLSKNGELWRLRVTEEEFLSEIEKIRKYEIENRKKSLLNSYHIERNIEAMISVLLMDGVTIEEAKEQAESNRKLGELSFAKEAPEIQNRLSQIQTPLKFRDIVNLYKWLCRQQITIEMIPENVLNEFLKTDHYKKILLKDKNKSN